jgi:hypothetical protein
MGTAKKLVLSFLIIFLSVAIIFVTASSTTTTSKDVRSRASTTTTNSVSLTLTPNEAIKKVGDEFDVQVFFNTFGKQVSGVDAQISYDPVYLEVLSVNPGTIFGTYPASVNDSAKGIIHLGGLAFDPKVGKPQDPFVGTGVLGSIKMRAKSPTSSTMVQFLYNPSNESATSQIVQSTTATDILEKVYNATFTIEK